MSTASPSPRRRVLFFGCYDSGPGYPRVRSLRAGFESHGVEVVELREDLLPTREERRSKLRRPLAWPGLFAHLRSGSKRLEARLRALLREEAIDALVVPYPAWFSIGTARRVFDGPILLDLFLSLADTCCHDRSIFRRHGLAEFALRKLDRRTCALADRVVLDTPVHARRIADLLHLDPERIGFVQVGDPDAPLTAPPLPVVGDRVHALYVGTGVPLHGVDHILDACEVSDGVALSFVGGSEAQRERAAKLPCTVLVEPWVETEALQDLFAAQHAVFGIFGASAKARSVIPYKVIHGLAHGRVVITAETEAVQTMLAPGVDCMTTPIADAEGIARTLLCLREGPLLAERIAARGAQRFATSFSARSIGHRLLLNLAEIDGATWGPLLGDDVPISCDQASEALASMARSG